jgi:hypothetical protein
MSAVAGKDPKSVIAERSGTRSQGLHGEFGAPNQQPGN